MAARKTTTDGAAAHEAALRAIPRSMIEADRAIASRDSMQLFVCTRHGGKWRVDAVMNARRMTLEQQLFADDFESLAAPERRAVKDQVARLAR